MAATAAGALGFAPEGAREIVITRTLEAPRDKVFAAWTQPALLKKWLLGPPGWSFSVCEVDLRPGGKVRFAWRNALGFEMGLRSTYREIVAPERIVHTEKFDVAWYPGEAEITTLFAEADGRTTVTLTIAYESTQARDIALNSGMKDGIAASYDRLAALVEPPAR